MHLALSISSIVATVQKSSAIVGETLADLVRGQTEVASRVAMFAMPGAPAILAIALRPVLHCGERGLGHLQPGRGMDLTGNADRIIDKTIIANVHALGSNGRMLLEIAEPSVSH